MWIDHRLAQEIADHSERERTTVKASATHGFASEPNLQRLRRERVGRRVVLSVLALFVLAGAAGLLGVRSRTVSASANGYDLSVTYATMTRSGLSTPWSFSVHRDGGFEGPVTVATTLDYFELFDENGLDPDPSAATVSGELLVWTFDPPEGETLSVDFDARLGPAVQSGKHATTIVLDRQIPVVQVSYDTRVMP